MTEGYIKFNINWHNTLSLMPPDVYRDLTNARIILYDLNLIGVLSDGIGFGNISYRNKNENNFFISGSATGNLRVLTPNHYSFVENFDIANNFCSCIGTIKASSESLTHGAIYIANKNAKSVIHIHNFALWEKYMNVYQTTHKNAEFGTPELAKEIETLVKKNFEININSGIIILAGHPDGIISYGVSLKEAMNNIFALL